MLMRCGDDDDKEDAFTCVPGVKTGRPRLMMPAFCQAMASSVGPRSSTWS